MKVAISSLKILLLLNLVRAETGAGGGGGGTTAGSITEAVPSTSPTSPDTSGSGVKGVHPGSMTDTTSSGPIDTTMGPTSVYTTTNGGGGGGSTVTGTTTLPASSTEAASSGGGTAGGGNVAASVVSDGNGVRVEGVLGGQKGVLYGVAMCIITGFS